MPTRVRLLRIAGLALSLALTAGCAEDARPPVRNHAPKQAYLITLTVENPPAPVTAIEGHASYQVMNTECLPRAFFFGYPTGVRAIAEPVQFKPVSANVWQAVVYADLYPDQPQTDELGVCEWKFIAAGADFSIGKITLAATLNDEEIRAGESSTQYYEYAWLNDPVFVGARVHGNTRKREGRETFVAVVSSKEVGP